MGEDGLTPSEAELLLWDGQGINNQATATVTH